VDGVSAEACLQKTNADAFLIGRAALGKPWILSVLDGAETPSNVVEVVLEHFDRLLSYYGQKGVYIARKHLAWYASGHSFVAQFRQNVYNEDQPDKIRFLIKEFFSCDG
jgi:tRNA-dihydrouridine synthase B